MSAVGAAVAMTAQRGGAAACDRQQDLVVLPGNPVATAFEEGLPCTANDVGHLQRRPVYGRRIGSPVPFNGSASSGLDVALRWRLERCR